MKFFNKSKAFFLDRDGVIVKDIGYLKDEKELIFFKDIFKVLKYIKKKNYLIIIITNQSVVGRKIISLKKLNEIHHFMKKKFLEKKIKIDDIYFCPHHPSEGIGSYKKKCLCRKPGNLLIEKAIKKWKINRKESFMIGDRKSDFLAAKKSKINFFYRPKQLFFKKVSKKII